MNNYRKGRKKGLGAAAFSVLLAGIAGPSFAGDADPGAASRGTPVNEVTVPAPAASTYALHAALLRAPASPVAAARR